MVLLVIVVVLILIGAYLMIFQRGWVNSVYIALTSTSSQLEEKLQENKQLERDAINSAGLSSLDDETEKKLLEGNLSEEQVVEILLGKPQTENAPEGQENVPEELDKEDVKEDLSTEPQTDNPDSAGKQTDKPANADKPQMQEPEKAPVTDKTTQTDKAEYDRQIAELVAKMYVLKTQYTSKINALVDAMKSEYSALPKEKRNTASKSEIAARYMNSISAMEAQADAQVNEIVSKLKAVLKESGGDMTLADSIVSAYQKEKEITKSYYINRYS